MKKLIGILLWATALAAPAFAQTAALMPQPFSQFFDNNGIPLSGGLVYTYQSGTSTPLSTYTDAGAGTPNSNPVVLDASGRANIWLLNQPYRIVVKTSSGVTITTTDGVLAGGFTNTGAWAVNGSTIYNSTAGTKVCIGATPCTTALAQLNVTGASSGTNYLFRIDDSAGSPGINLYASGNSVGSYSGDSGGLRLRAAGGSSQVTVSQGNVTVQDASAAGTTSLTLAAGAAQGSANFLQIQSPAGTNVAWVDSAGRFVSPLYNSTATGAATAFQNSNSFFSVNGFGDLTVNGQVNAVGTNDTVNGADGGAYKVNGSIVIDNQKNATFRTLTCTSTPCGSGGGGGGLPVSDATNIVFNAATPSKVLKFDASAISASTTRTAKWPDANITVVGEENAETLSGAKTFSSVVTGSAGFAGTVFNSTATGTTTAFQLNNLNFLLDGKGNITTSCTAGCTAGVDGADAIFGGYVTAGTWFGLTKTTGTPSTTPGNGNSAITYKGGTSGLHIWLYDTVHTAWSDIDLGAVAGGITSINGQTGSAQTIAGGTGITATTTTNTVTLSLPQAVGTTSPVTFASVTTGSGGAFNSGAGAGQTAFQTSNFAVQIDGSGNISGAGQVNLTGGGSAYKMGGTTVIDSSRNATFNNVTINGSCLGNCGGGGGGGVTSAAGTFNQVLVNGGTGAATGAITLSLPQSIGTASTPTFGAVIANGAFNSTVSGAGIAFQTSNSNFSVDGLGDVSAATQFNTNGSYKVLGNVVINSSRQFVGNGVDVGPNGISAGNYNTYGGGIGQTWNVNIPGMSISGTSCTSGLIFRGGILISCY